jgi:hypothetical protein
MTPEQVSQLISPRSTFNNMIKTEDGQQYMPQQTSAAPPASMGPGWGLPMMNGGAPNGTHLLPGLPLPTSGFPIPHPNLSSPLLPQSSLDSLLQPVESPSHYDHPAVSSKVQTGTAMPSSHTQGTFGSCHSPGPNPGGASFGVPSPGNPNNSPHLQYHPPESHPSAHPGSHSAHLGSGGLAAQGSGLLQHQASLGRVSSSGQSPVGYASNRTSTAGGHQQQVAGGGVGLSGPAGAQHGHQTRTASGSMQQFSVGACARGSGGGAQPGAASPDASSESPAEVSTRKISLG